MSGGSYDYLYRKMQEASVQLTSLNQPLHIRAFGDLMMKCAEAMHDIEWVESGDLATGDEMQSVMACINDEQILKIAVQDAERARDKLIDLIGCKDKWVD